MSYLSKSCISVFLVFGFSIIIGFPQNQCNYTFEGKVINADDRQAASFVVVFLEELNVKTTTDSNGYFKFNNLCHQSYNLLVKGIGYKEFKSKFHIHKNVNEIIYLHSDTCLLESVTITAKEESQPEGHQLLSLDAQSLKLVRGNSLGESVKNLPGVNAYQSGPNVYKPMIQGMYGNRVMILSNGVRLEGQNWGNDHAPEIDPFVANEISVIKGASAVQYGADAIGGVVQVISAPLRIEKGWDAEINSVYGSNNKQGVISGIVNIGSGKIKGLGFRLQGTAERSGNYKTPKYYLSNTGQAQYNFSWAADYIKEKWGLKTYYSIYKNKNGIFSGAHLHSVSDFENTIINGSPYTQNATFSYNINRAYQKTVHELTKIESYYNLTSKHSLNGLFSRQVNQRQEFDVDRPLSDIISGNNEATVSFGLTSYNAQFFLKSKFKNLNQIVGIGVLNQNNTVNTRGVRLFLPFYTQNYLYAYLIEKIRIKRLLLELGTRIENRNQIAERYLLKETKKYLYNSSSFSATYFMNEHLSFSGISAFVVRPPAMNELYSDGLHQGDGTFIQGNSILNPEKNSNNQLNIKYQNRRSQFDISFYHNYFLNYIYLNPSGEILTTVRGSYPVFAFTQTKARFSGIDAQFIQQVFSDWEIIAQGSVLNAYDISRNDYLPFVPANKFSIKLKYKIKDLPKFKESYMAITSDYVMQQKRVPQTSTFSNLNSNILFQNLLNFGDYTAPPAAYSLFKFEGMTTLNIGKQKFGIALVISNFLNTRYRDYLNRFRYYANEIGINAQLKLNYKF